MLYLAGWNDANQPMENNSIFTFEIEEKRPSRGSETNWPPITFMSKKLLSVGMACLFVSRHENGNWSLVVRAMVPPELLEYWKVSIKVTNLSWKSAHALIFTGI